MQVIINYCILNIMLNIFFKSFNNLRAIGSNVNNSIISYERFSSKYEFNSDVTSGK